MALYLHSSYIHSPIPHSLYLQTTREWRVRRSQTANTVETIPDVSAGSVPAVCAEGRTSRGVRYCVMTATRPSTSGASLLLSGRSPRKMSGESVCSEGREGREGSMVGEWQQFWAVEISRATISARFLSTHWKCSLTYSVCVCVCVCDLGCIHTGIVQTVRQMQGKSFKPGRKRLTKKKANMQSKKSSCQRDWGKVHHCLCTQYSSVATHA